MQYRCASALKLLEIDRKFELIRRTRCRAVLDLAAAPGGFAQVSLERMRAAAPTPEAVTHRSSSSSSPTVIAVDLRPIAPLPGMIPVRANVLHQEVILRALREARLTEPIRVVTHDGVSVVDGQEAFSVHYAQCQMALSALQLACKVFSGLPVSSPTAEGTSRAGRTQSVSRPSHGRAAPVPAAFVTKLMRCSHSGQVTAAARHLFSRVRTHKPSASPPGSRETYLVADGFLSQRWSSVQRGTDRSGRRLFSLPPERADVVSGRQVVWLCLGCGQSRVGCVPCPLCG